MSERTIADWLANRRRTKEQFSCSRKVRHDTQESADGARRLMRVSAAKRARLVTYSCPFCFGWHVGKRRASADRQPYKPAPIPEPVKETMHRYRYL